MKKDIQNQLKTIIDREKLMTLKKCAACGKPFTLGDPVVLACGAWEGTHQFIHENEAVFDSHIKGYVERRCHEASKGKI